METAKDILDKEKSEFKKIQGLVEIASNEGDHVLEYYHLAEIQEYFQELEGDLITHLEYRTLTEHYLTQFEEGNYDLNYTEELGQYILFTLSVEMLNMDPHSFEYLIRKLLLTHILIHKIHEDTDRIEKETKRLNEKNAAYFNRPVKYG